LKIRKVEIDEAPFLAERFEITNVPTMLLFVNGKVAETIVGARPLDVLQKDLKSYIQPETKEDDHGEHLG
jgi:thioredoxin 1